MAYLTMADAAASFNDQEYVASVIERIASRVTVTPAGCHECSLGINDTGYSTISFGNRMWRTHRLLWFIRKGEVPSHLVLDHLCRNPKCCNLDHLELVTNAENIRRGNATRPVGAKRKFRKPRTIRTTCRKGHLYDGFTRGGRRDCRICAYAVNAKIRASMSPEKREAQRAKQREYMRASRLKHRSQP